MDKAREAEALKQIFGSDYTPLKEKEDGVNGNNAAANAAPAEPALPAIPEAVEALPAEPAPPVIETSEPVVTVSKKDDDIDLSDEKILEILKKRKGIEIKSLDELAPKEDPAIIAEKRELAKITYAFEKGLITRKEYDSFVTDKANPHNVFFEDYAADAREADPEITDEQIAEDFAEEFGINAEKDSAKYKRGQKRLSKFSENLIRQKHPNFFKIDDEFSRHETEISERETRNKEILQQTPVYRKDVEDAISASAKMNIPFSNNETYQVTIPDDVLTDIKKEFFRKDFIEDQITKGYSPDDIKMAIRMAIYEKSFAKIVESVSAERLLAHSKGTHGIPAPINLKQEQMEKPKLSEKEMKAAISLGLMSAN